MTRIGSILVVFGGLVCVFALLALQIERHPDARAIYNGFAWAGSAVFLVGVLAKGSPLVQQGALLPYSTAHALNGSARHPGETTCTRPPTPPSS